MLCLPFHRKEQHYLCFERVGETGKNIWTRIMLQVTFKSVYVGLRLWSPLLCTVHENKTRSLGGVSSPKVALDLRRPSFVSFIECVKQHKL